MVRRALTYQLILAVAVGPLLCCCTSGRLLASLAPRPTAPATVSHTSIPARHVTSPCCAHKHRSAKPDADHGHGGPKPAPSKPGEKCPCKDGASKAKTAPSETLTSGISTTLRALTLDLLTPFLTVDSTVCLVLPGVHLGGPAGGSAALLSTADLLYAHHNLRC